MHKYTCLHLLQQYHALAQLRMRLNLKGHACKQTQPCTNKLTCSSRRSAMFWCSPVDREPLRCLVTSCRAQQCSKLEACWGGRTWHTSTQQSFTHNKHTHACTQTLMCAHNTHITNAHQGRAKKAAATQPAKISGGGGVNKIWASSYPHSYSCTTGQEVLFS